MSQHNGYAQKPPKIVEWLSYHISMEQGLTKMALVEMYFEQRFCRASTYPVRVKASCDGSVFSAELNLQNP